jgi:N-acetylmuramoyl-L-alanine amidase
LIARADTCLACGLVASPNFGPRREGVRPGILLLHYTGMATAQSAIDWLTRVESGVSCHYAVDEAGRITQMVAEDMRAWHAGDSFWAGESDINSASIGIEIHNPGHDFGYPDFAQAQLEAVAALCKDIVARHGIAPERVLAHSDVAPHRKQDPGEKFPWGRLHSAGIGHWVAPAPVVAAEAGMGVGVAGPLMADVQLLLAKYGYGIEATGVIDGRTELVAAAFQRHFRQERVDGRIDQSTITTLQRLVAALPPAKASS